MIPLSLSHVADAVDGAVHQVPQATGSTAGVVDAEPVVDAEVVVDSRAVVPGSLFAAIVGERVDGHDFIAEAARAGAVAALVSRPVPDAPIPTIEVADVPAALGALARAVLELLRERTPLQVVAVTGSAGKTTTKDLLAQVLAPMGAVIAPVGSFNNEIGLPLTVLRAGEDTRVLVLEMGADAPGNLTYLTSIAPPDVAVVLIVGRAHLGGFGSIEGIAAAKSELVQGLRAEGTAVLNADDPRVAAMAPVSAGACVLTYGTDPTAQVRAEQIGTDPAGHVRLTLVTEASSAVVTSPLVGQHHTTNILAAATAALSLGRPLTQIADSLSRAGALSPHRMQVTRSGGITVVDDSYNANPDSMRAALQALATLGGQDRTVAVLGEMLELGADSETEHEHVGRAAAAAGTDVLVAVGAGAAGIARGARAAGVAQVETPTSVATAQEMLAGILRGGDVVLVKASNGAGLMAVAEMLTEHGEGAGTEVGR